MAVMKEYIAGKRLKIGDGWREPGQPVPEAAHWRTLQAYINSGAVIVTWRDVPNDADLAGDRAETLMALKKDELQNLAQSMDVAIYGSKKDIVERIVEAELHGSEGQPAESYDDEDLVEEAERTGEDE